MNDQKKQILSMPGTVLGSGNVATNKVYKERQPLLSQSLCCNKEETNLLITDCDRCYTGNKKGDEVKSKEAGTLNGTNKLI